jgi:hypothetical protein
MIGRVLRNQVASRLGSLDPNLALHAHLSELSASINDLKVQLGSLQVAQMRAARCLSPREAEFKVFSQFGEDGILQYLIWKLSPLPESFVEFGVGNYTEANTLFLLMHDNWRGLIMDRSASDIQSVLERPIAWRHDLRAVPALIHRENINELIESNGMSGEIGVLSIDIDGIDYWVWERIDVVQPVVVVVEYNSVFGTSRAVTVPYDPNFDRTRAHYSNLYWGCSLPALCHLAERKGYLFVGSNSAGNNAFFVRRGRQRDLESITAEEGYVESRFRESRDVSGELTFLSGAERLAAIADLPLIDVETGATITAREVTRQATSRDQGRKHL